MGVATVDAARLMLVESTREANLEVGVATVDAARERSVEMLLVDAAAVLA